MKTRDVAVCGLFVALIAVCAWVSFPLPFTPVPITLQTFAVALCGLFLGWRRGLLAVAAYLLLGAAGAPVFAGFRAGLGAVLGPTGGFLVGFVPGVAVIGAVRAALAKRTKFIYASAVAVFAGEAVILAFGAAWLAVSRGMGIWAAALAAVVPFLPGEGFKALLAVAAAAAISRTPARP